MVPRCEPKPEILRMTIGTKSPTVSGQNPSFIRAASCYSDTPEEFCHRDGGIPAAALCLSLKNRRGNSSEGVCVFSY